ncbi:hypothetical protein [Domibacillus mangrovi]|uniref:Uncharacterized protein n=1 Tax=Domibacillus mangrovi TaxID=1714354 RepID=A0A1Q5P6H8_9BACI|nr:hypothetical protein [Domibacillus mangrovi]OKL37879.1 hypothetical protein BLL40_00140 [Domibacillus mangrovi]
MVSRSLKWITGGLEALLGIPYISLAFVVSWDWRPLVIMLFLHMFALFYSAKEKTNKTASILGIVISIVGWIPVVGVGMHLVTAFLLLKSAAKHQSVTEKETSTTSI